MARGPARHAHTASAQSRRVVRGPTIASGLSPTRRWNRRTAAAVLGPKLPSSLAESQSVAPEQELEHADVVTTRAAPDGPGSEERSPSSTQGGSSSRTRNAVDGEPMPPLEYADGAHGLRPLDSVDRPAVQAVLAERDLEPGDLWVDRAGRGRECEGGQSGRDRERQTAHPPGVGGVSLVSFFQVIRKVF